MRCLQIAETLRREDWGESFVEEKQQRSTSFNALLMVTSLRREELATIAKKQGSLLTRYGSMGQSLAMENVFKRKRRQ